MAFSGGAIFSEYDPSLFHFLCQFAFYFAAAAVLYVFEVPGDPLIHSRIFRHLMRGVPFPVERWFHEDRIL